MLNFTFHKFTESRKCHGEVVVPYIEATIQDSTREDLSKISWLVDVVLDYV
jgi:hypothetical protein